MALGGRPQEYVVDSGPRPILRVLGYPDTLGDLIRRGEADAVDLLRQGVRVLLHRLDGQIPVRLVDADSPPGTDPMAVEEEPPPTATMNPVPLIRRCNVRPWVDTGWLVEGLPASE